MVVAIACVVVLATNSMRSYARDAWRSFAAPVVTGLQLIESDHSDPRQPREPAAPSSSTAPATTQAADLHRAAGPAHAVRSHHDVKRDTIVAVKSPQPQPSVVSAPVVSAPVVPPPAVQAVTTASPGHSHESGSFAAIPSHDNGQHTGWADHGPAAWSHGASGWDSSSSSQASNHGGWSGWATSPGHSASSSSSHGASSRSSYAVAASISIAQGHSSSSHAYGYGNSSSHGYGHSSSHGYGYGYSSSSHGNAYGHGWH